VSPLFSMTAPPGGGSSGSGYGDANAIGNVALPVHGPDISRYTATGVPALTVNDYFANLFRAHRSGYVRRVAYIPQTATGNVIPVVYRANAASAPRLAAGSSVAMAGASGTWQEADVGAGAAPIIAGDYFWAGLVFSAAAVIRGASSGAPFSGWTDTTHLALGGAQGKLSFYAEPGSFAAPANPLPEASRHISLLGGYVPALFAVIEDA
jgi:hypothetical protein